MIWVALFLLILEIPLFAHGGKDHRASKIMVSTPSSLEQINSYYKKDIKEIFKAKCYDCHSSFTRTYWHSHLPIAKQMIERDIRDGRKHLDMSHDFPFEGHGSPKEDLQAIAKTIERSDMPPMRYRLLHPKSKLTSSEEETILLWIEKSLELLNKGVSQHE